MEYKYQQGDELAIAARLAPHFEGFAEPLDVQLAVFRDDEWRDLRLDLQREGEKLLRLELDDDQRGSTSLAMKEGPFDARLPKFPRMGAEAVSLWQAVLLVPALPDGMELCVRDFLLESAGDATPSNALRVIELYRILSRGDADTLYVALGILRANTIARKRQMPIEATVRQDLMRLVERVLTATVFPGIALRHVEAIAEAPRSGHREADELERVGAALDRIEAQNRDPSTIDAVSRCRIRLAETEEARTAAQRHHVEEYLHFSEADTVPFRSMLWAEDAVGLAERYGLTDLRDKAVVRMQRLSRTDLGWATTSHELRLPKAPFRQRARVAMKFTGWEQALGVFLAGPSPAGDIDKHRRDAKSVRRGLRDLVTNRFFGSHQLPERTGGSAEDENLAKLIEGSLLSAGMVLRTDLNAIAERFVVPSEEALVRFVSAHYDSAPELVVPFAQSLRLFWSGDWSGAARLGLPLIETGARELLLVLDAPLYRKERDESPGRFPAMDFYVQKLEELGFDPDWAAALRGVLLSSGMNLRNKYAHGYQVHFTADQAALILRLAGLFMALPVGLDGITQESLRDPLKPVRVRLRRRLGWVWR